MLVVSHIFTSFAFFKYTNINWGGPIINTNNIPLHSNLVSEPLICCLKSREFCPDFYHSFSIPSFCWIAPKITIKCLFVIFLTSFSMVWSLVCLSYFFIICLPERRIICVPEKRAANICRMANDSPMLDIKWAPADQNKQTCRLGPMSNYVSIFYFHG